MLSKWNIFLLTIFFSINGYSQPYQPLLETNNEWHFTTCFNGCLTDVYYTNSDTIVNGLSHKILDGYHYISRTFLLRENTEEKKVYLTKINPNRIDTYLLYDFSLEEGDTFDMKNPITPFPAEGGLFVLDSIRNRPFQENEIRRYFYFSPHPENTVSSQNAIWVEGVGSLSIINAPGGYPELNSVGSLTCFYKNSTLFYMDEDEETPICAETILHIYESITLQPEIIFHSTTKELSINSNEKWQSCVLYDLLGQQLAVNHSLVQNSWSLQKFALPSGIYLIKLTFENQVITKKIHWNND
jgi:hypothetical protein